MAGPNTLHQHGNDVTYPTWGFRLTRLGVQSLDPNNYAAVFVTAGAGSEAVTVDGGGTTFIDRDWGGLPVNVVNSRNDMNVPVQVWTE